MEQTLIVPQGQFVLKRLPLRSHELLQAWDAADEYLLNYLQEAVILKPGIRVLIVNDSFGALAVALSVFSPVAWSDSYLSQQATRLNLSANTLPEFSVTLVNSVDNVTAEFDLVLIKVPKTLALLEDQLLRLRAFLLPTSTVIVASMIKNLPSSVWDLLERLLGKTTTSLARKKARLIFVSSLTQDVLPNPYPVEYRLEGTDYLISNHANVFSRERLDIGTRFFIENLPGGINPCDIIDLGCGNGVVGLIAAVQHPQARLHFIDESFMAVASARENFYRVFGEKREARFIVDDGLMNVNSQSADLILCNPPFHQEHTIGNQIALSFFKTAHRVLKKHGELWVIGNRHLNYHVDLKRLFSNQTLVAANAKFVILKAWRN